MRNFSLTFRFFFTGTVEYAVPATGTLTGSNFDDTTGTLTLTDGRFDPIGQVDVMDKSVSGIIPCGSNQATFWLSYQGEV